MVVFRRITVGISAQIKTMKKPVLDLLVVTVAILMWANTSSAHPVPDGGATASLFVVGVAGLAIARKFRR